MKKQYSYTAYTSNQDGTTFTDVCSLDAAFRRAKKYAMEAFPKWTKNYGPTLKVRCVETGEIFTKSL